MKIFFLLLLFIAVLTSIPAYAQVDSSKAEHEKFPIIGVGIGYYSQNFGLDGTVSLIDGSNEVELRILHTIGDPGAEVTHEGGTNFFSGPHPTTYVHNFPNQQLTDVSLLYGRTSRGRTLRARSVWVGISAGITYGTGIFRGDKILSDSIVYQGINEYVHYGAKNLHHFGYTVEAKLGHNIWRNFGWEIKAFYSHYSLLSYSGAVLTLIFGNLF